AAGPAKAAPIVWRGSASNGASLNPLPPSRNHLQRLDSQAFLDRVHPGSMATAPQLKEELPPPSEDGGGLDVREYVQILWTYKWLILGITAVVSVAVVFWTLRQ